MAELDADRKLCLTGTPLVNHVSDLHSLLTFLNVQPLCQPDIFNNFITEPIKARKEIGMDRLRTIMAYICLRRTKQAVMSTIQLVSKTGTSFRRLCSGAALHSIRTFFAHHALAVLQWRFEVSNFLLPVNTRRPTTPCMTLHGPTLWTPWNQRTSKYRENTWSF